MRDLGADAASAWELELDIGVSGPMAAQGEPKRHLPLAADKIGIIDMFAKGAVFHIVMSQEGHAVLLHSEVLLAKRACLRPLRLLLSVLLCTARSSIGLGCNLTRTLLHRRMPACEVRRNFPTVDDGSPFHGQLAAQKLISCLQRKDNLSGAGVALLGYSCHLVELVPHDVPADGFPV